MVFAFSTILLSGPFTHWKAVPRNVRESPSSTLIFITVRLGAQDANDLDRYPLTLETIFICMFTLTGNGTEDIVSRYCQPSRLFFFSLHLYDKEDAARCESSNNSSSSSSSSPAKQKPLSPTRSAASSSATSISGYEFYPGSGAEDDVSRNILNVPLAPLWVLDNIKFSTRAKAGQVF